MERLKYLKEQKNRIGYLADKVREGEGLTEKELEEVAEAMDCELDYIEDCYKGSDFEFIICQFADELQERYLLCCACYDEAIEEFEKMIDIRIDNIGESWKMYNPINVLNNMKQQLQELKLRSKR